MRQLYFTFLLCVSIINAQDIQISDTNFRNALIELGFQIDNPDGLVERNNFSNVFFLDISGQNIDDLSGIEAFSNLEVLIADNNNLKSLDLTQNTGLKEISVSNNRLTSIDVSNNPALEELNVFKNRLSEIRLLNNRNLNYLAVADNNLTELDLVNNRRLEKLYCQNNQLTSLNLSGFPFLDTLNCEFNNLSSLFVEDSPELFQLNASNNNLTDIDVSSNVNLIQFNVLYNQLTAVNLSANTVLSVILVAFNNLESLNIKNGNNVNLRLFRAEGNTNLACITVDDDVAENNADNVLGRWNIDFNSNYSSDCGSDDNDTAEEDTSQDIISNGNNANRVYNVFVGNDKTLNIESKQKASLNVINLQGVSIINTELTEGSNAISMSDALSSVYVLQISNEKGIFTKKILLN